MRNGSLWSNVVFFLSLLSCNFDVQLGVSCVHIYRFGISCNVDITKWEHGSLRIIKGDWHFKRKYFHFIFHEVPALKWSAWSMCSRTCGDGVEMRMAYCYDNNVPGCESGQKIVVERNLCRNRHCFGKQIFCVHVAFHIIWSWRGRRFCVPTSPILRRSVYKPGPNFIELLSTKICLALNFFLGKNRNTNRISILLHFLVTGIQLLYAYLENHVEMWLRNPVLIKANIWCWADICA